MTTIKSFEIPRPADFKPLVGVGPSPSLVDEGGKAVWFVFVCGWRAGVFGNYLYRWSPDTGVQWVEGLRPTDGRGTVYEERAAGRLWLWSRAGETTVAQYLPVKFYSGG